VESNQNVESKRKSVESRNEKRGVQNTNSSLFRVQPAHTISHAEIAQWIELSSHVKQCYVFWQTLSKN